MTTRMKPRADSAIVDVWKRQVGALSARNFAHRRAASEDLVLRFDVLHKLDKHRGCVNTVSFNATGDILVSGADDKNVILWNWETGKVQLSFHSGHDNNIFQAKFMPYTEDRSIVTCAADGQVRLAQIVESGKVETKLLAKHRGRSHKLAIEPGSSHVFYTCGEDGLVQHIDLRTGTATALFTCKPVLKYAYSPIVGLYAITMARNPNFFAVGASDPFARLYDIRKTRWDASSDLGRPVDLFCPPHLIDDDSVGVTGLAFSHQNELLASYNNEFIYLFTKDMGLGPDLDFTTPCLSGVYAVETNRDNHTCSSPSSADDNGKAAPQVYKGHRNCETVKGVNFFGPKSEYVVSGSDCGRIFIWKKKDGELIRVMEADKSIVNCIESHPHAAVLASSGIEHDVKIWVPKLIDRASLPTNIDKVSNWHPTTFFTFGGFYADDEDDYDCIDSDDDDDDGDDDSDTSGDGDEDEEYEDENEDEDCDSDSDYITPTNDKHSENEGLSEEQIEKEHYEEDDDEDEDCDSDSDYITPTDDKRSENEGLSEEQMEEEHYMEDDMHGDSYDAGGGNENVCYDDEVADRVASEVDELDNDSSVDICDVDDCSVFGCEETDLDCSESDSWFYL